MSGGDSPVVVVLAGPNGAGKSTVAREVLQGALGVNEFVNADAIAAGLSGFAPAAVAFEAGRIMLARLHRLAEERRDFAFETTLSSRSFAPWLAGLVSSGYQLHIVFLRLPAAELALARVADRVAKGGHGIPADDVRRRFGRGLDNLFSLYAPLSSSWRMLDGSGFAPCLIYEDPRACERGTPIDEACRVACAKALRWHQWIGTPYPVWDGTKVVHVDPRTIRLAG